MADTQPFFQDVGLKLPLILPTVTALLAVFLLQTLFKRQSLANIPVAGQDLGGDEKRRQAYLLKASELYLDGYRKVGRLLQRHHLLSLLMQLSVQFKDSIFRIVTSNSNSPPKPPLTPAMLTWRARIHRHCGATQVPGRTPKTPG